MLPVISGFYQGATNIKYAVGHYQGGLYAQSLLFDMEAIQLKGGKMNDEFSSPEFAEEYDTELEYASAIYIPENGIWSLSELAVRGASQELAQNMATEINFNGGLRLSRERDSAQSVIYYDGSFRSIKGSLSSFADGEYRIDYDQPDDMTVEVVFFKEITDPIDLVINNIGEGALYIDIYAADIELLQISLGESVNSFITCYPYAQWQEAVLAVAVNNQQGQTIGKMLKPIYYVDGDFPE